MNNLENGRIDNIFIVPRAGEKPLRQAQVTVRAGKGIAGDRYFLGTGTYSNSSGRDAERAVTFIEAEQVERFNAGHGLDLDYGDLRRNIVTRGVDLNALVGEDFYLGDVLFHGMELCEPCAYLARKLGAPVLPHLVGRGGLRAAALSSGRLSVGDRFQPAGH